MEVEEYSKHEKIQIKVLTTKEEKVHFQQEIELLYILEGSLNLQLADQEFLMKKEDIIIVNANKHHSFTASDDVLFCKIIFSYQMISEGIGNSSILFWCNSTVDKNAAYGKIREIIKSLLNQYVCHNGIKNSFGQRSLLFGLIDVLISGFLIQSDDRVFTNEKEKLDDRIQQINNYIRSNYNRAISLNDLSEKLFLSNAYLSRYFKKNFGMNFIEYLTNIRLYHAVDDLLYTNYPITRIALDNGFPSVTVFNKVFKQTHHKTPSVYRKNIRENNQNNEIMEDTQLATDKLEHYLSDEGEDTISEDNKKNVHISHNVLKNEKYDKTWQKLINFGDASDLLTAGVREHILLIKDQLDFEYVRFWNIFSGEMLIDVKNPEQKYNFTQIDSLLDFLVNNHIKPFIELGQKPKRVNKTVNEAVVFEEGEPLFTSLREWEAVLEAFMRHLLRRYGREDVGKWKFELWRDARLARQEPGYEVGYLEIFNSAFEIIKKFIPEAKVGGCGVQLDYAKQEFEDLLEQWKKQKYWPDFLSIISYAYIKGEEEGEKFSKRSTDSDFLLNSLNTSIDNMKEKGFLLGELYISEWNLTVSDRNYINDTCYKGAYIVKNIIETFDKAQMIGYFIGSDRFSEYFDSNEVLHGGTGLVSRDGILKPSGYAYMFLKNLYSYYIAKGENYLLTTNRNNEYGMICHNYKKMNYSYYLTNEDEIAKDKMWKYFEDREILELDIHLDNLENGNYQIKVQRVNEKNGSIFNEWENMDFYSDLSSEDVKYLRRICTPRLTIQKYTVENGTLDYTIVLLANEIAFVRITKFF